jgi:hypothetical protein
MLIASAIFVNVRRISRFKANSSQNSSQNSTQELSFLAVLHQIITALLFEPLSLSIFV